MNIMKRFSLLASLAGIVALTQVALAQDPVITSMRDGKVTFTNVTAGQEYKVEWATTLNDTNGFRSSFAGMEDIVPTNAAAMTVDVPQFFRIRSPPGLSNNIYRASDIQLVVNTYSHSAYTLEWADKPEGPWFSSWEPFFESTSTGTVVRVPTPNYYRVTFP